MESSASSSGLVNGGTVSKRGRTYSLANPPMPWFGVDIGGTLAKLVYFEPNDHQDFTASNTEVERETIELIHRYLMSQRTYGLTGERDEHLELEKVTINGRQGTLHFIHFPTSRMRDFIDLVKAKGFTQLSSTVCATGGGAHKFEQLIHEELGMSLHKFDELETLIVGMRAVVAHHVTNMFSSEIHLWNCS